MLGKVQDITARTNKMVLFVGKYFINSSDIQGNL
jgi:hypothetical protein